MENNFTVLIPIIGYFIALVAFNLYLKYRDAKQNNSKNADYVKNYAIADRNLTPLALAMGTASTYASASSFISGPGTAYYYGLGWVLIALIQVPTMWFTFSVLGTRINHFATKHNCATINEILLVRFQSHGLVALTSIILVVCFIASIVVQFIGAARLLQGAVGIPYQQALLIFAVVIAIYTVIGNFKTVSYSDILQGFIMIIGSLLLLGFTLYKVGGLDKALEIITMNSPELLDPYNKIISPQLYFSFWVLVCFGILGLPQTVLKTMANTKSKQRLRAIIISTITLLIILLAMHLSGFLANSIIQQGSISSPDLVIPTLITKVMSPVLAAIFLIAPMAAIISTIDSMLIQCTSTVVNDVVINNYKRFINYGNNLQINGQKAKIAIRLTTFSIICIALLSSLNPPNLVIWLNLLSFGGLQATFLWPILLGLFTNWLNKYAALASVVSGIGTYAILTFSGFKLFGLHQIVPALTCSLVFLLVVQFITNRTSK